MRILGIETSCDETGIAIYDGAQARVIAEALHSQIDIHQRYGGVVPEMASRDHISRVLPLVRQLMAESGTRMTMLDGVAYTAGPGLMGALLVGAAIGRGMAFAWGIPGIPIHHMEAHLLVALLGQDRPSFPFLALLVSGGHTLLVRVAAYATYTVLGESLDDAVGEAFDKTAKLLGLPYPGGPAVSALAEGGVSGRFHLPRPMTTCAGLDFSFSGLKTAVLTLAREQDGSEQTRADIALAFVDAVVDTLTIKCKRAMTETGIKQLVVAGGVSANRQLRTGLEQLAKEMRAQVYFPPSAYCTDNGAMIAYAGFLRLSEQAVSDDLDFQTRPRWPLSTL